MSALVVDTSSWIEWLGGRLVAPLREGLGEGRVHLPPIVVAEILSGRLSESHRRAIEALLNALPLCQSDLAHWFRVGALRHLLSSRGLQVSIPDTHVAQCALDLDAELLTEDAIFARIARHCPLRLAS